MRSKILNMLSMLQEYRRPKDQLMQQYIVNRLEKSYAQYDKELTYSKLYLQTKHEKSILKRLTKLNDKAT